MKIHPVFYVLHLEPVATDPLPGQVQPRQPPIAVEGNDEVEWEVDEIVDSKSVGRGLKYLVQWLGCDELTWEPATFLCNALTAVKRFHEAYPAKPCPRG